MTENYSGSRCGPPLQAADEILCDHVTLLSLLARSKLCTQCLVGVYFQDTMEVSYYVPDSSDVALRLSKLGLSAAQIPNIRQHMCA